MNPEASIYRARGEPLVDFLVTKDVLESSMLPFSSTRHDHTANPPILSMHSPRKLDFFANPAFYDPKEMDKNHSDLLDFDFRQTHRDAVAEATLRRKRERLPSIRACPQNVLPKDCEGAKRYRDDAYKAIVDSILPEPTEGELEAQLKTDLERVKKLGGDQDYYIKSLRSSQDLGGCAQVKKRAREEVVPLDACVDPAFLMNMYRPNASVCKTNTLYRPTSFKLDLWRSFGEKGEDMSQRYSNLGGWGRSLNPYPLSSAAQYGVSKIDSGYNPTY
jgi:hypothetical protein